MLHNTSERQKKGKEVGKPRKELLNHTLCHTKQKINTTIRAFAVVVELSSHTNRNIFFVTQMGERSEN